MPEKKLKNPANFLFSALIPIGLLFFVLPDYEIFDIVPDFIGFALLYFALEKIAWLDFRTELSRKYMLWFSALSILKLIVASFSGGFSDTSDTLLAVTVFSLLECLLLYQTASNFFNGFNYTLMRNSGGDLLKIASDAKFITYFFGFLKIGLNLVPPLFAVIEVDSIQTQNEQFFQSLSQIKSLTTLLCLTISLVLGIYWYKTIFKLYLTLRKDTNFINNAISKFNVEVNNYPKYHPRKRYLLAKYLGLISMFFFLTFHLDGQQRIPWFIGAIMMALTALLLTWAYKSYTKETLKELDPIFYCATLFLTITEAFSFFYRRTLNIELYIKFNTTQTILLAILASISGILLSFVWLRLLRAFRTTEEILYDVDLKNRYVWQYVFAGTFIALRTITNAAQPLREYLGSIEFLTFIVFISIYLWYLRKSDE